MDKTTIAIYRNRSATQTDLSWLLSIFASDAGTLMAVLHGEKAREYDDIIRQLERDIILLKVDEKILSQKLESA